MLSALPYLYGRIYIQPTALCSSSLAAVELCNECGCTIIHRCRNWGVETKYCISYDKARVVICSELVSVMG